MALTSRSVIPQQLASGVPVALTIAHVLMGALGAVVFFGMLAMIDTPYRGLLSNGFILSISIASIAAIAIVARDTGTLSPRDIEKSRIV